VCAKIVLLGKIVCVEIVLLGKIVCVEIVLLGKIVSIVLLKVAFYRTGIRVCFKKNCVPWLGEEQKVIGSEIVPLKVVCTWTFL